MLLSIILDEQVNSTRRLLPITSSRLPENDSLHAPPKWEKIIEGESKQE